MKYKLRFAATFLFLSAAHLPAAVIINNISGNIVLGGSGYSAHSFTIPAGQSYNSIRFSWLSPTGSPILPGGNLYLLSQEYLGSPSNLSTSTPGFLGVSSFNTSTEYVFNTSLTLNPSTQYWVYMDGTGTINGGGFGTTPYSGGRAYELYSAPPSTPYIQTNPNFDFNFLLSGEPVPEPSTPLLGSAALALAFLRRRRA